MEETTFCARCGKPIERLAGFAPDQPVYCSFSCETKALLGKLGWGVRWFVVSLGWGLTFLALLLLIGRIFWGAPISNPVAYGGLVVVMMLMVAILSVLLRRVKH